MALLSMLLKKDKQNFRWNASPYLQLILSYATVQPGGTEKRTNNGVRNA